MSIERRSVYGNVRHYVVGPAAEPMGILTGTRTLTTAQIEALRALGLGVRVTDVVA